jgi:hypothetical protein
MPLVKPRLTDHHRLGLTQAGVDFAIPFLDEDLPLYVDPFLLWRSPSMQEQSLHTLLINSFNHLGQLAQNGETAKAIDLLIGLSECAEVGLGNSEARKGKRIGTHLGQEIIQLFHDIPHYSTRGFKHFEEIQLYVEGISVDRISDITCEFLKSYLIDYTTAQCHKYGIPVASHSCQVYDYSSNSIKREDGLELPTNPVNGRPILLVPKSWLRYRPWINFDKFFESFTKDPANVGKNRKHALLYSRHNAAAVAAFIAEREASRASCHNDTLFTQIPLDSAKACIRRIENILPGNANNADKLYEQDVCKFLASVLYPNLDFAQDQVRTDSGSQIRDLIFYNNQQNPLLREIIDKYSAYQIVFEIKNVEKIEREHINQLNRYLKEDFGRFGVFVTRHPLPRSIERHVVDLWSGQRKCLVTLADEDLNMMASLYVDKQRDPIDVLQRNYVELTRKFPG